MVRLKITHFGKQARISPIDSIPKKGSEDRRVILNLSYPPEGGASVNDAVSKDHYLGQPTDLKYPTVDSLVDLIHEIGVGAALIKVDLRKYFRQVYYDPGSIHLVGFRVGKELYWDISLSMGLRIACYIAQRLSSAIIFLFHCLDNRNRGLNYIDDLAAVALWSRAYEAFHQLIDLLLMLNISESTHKRCPPDVVMTFLGVSVNSLKMLLSLTAPRMAEIKAEARIWLDKDCASKRDLQSLIGKLNFASATVRSGRLFFSRILNFMKDTPKHGIRKLDH